MRSDSFGGQYFSRIGSFLKRKQLKADGIFFKMVTQFILNTAITTVIELGKRALLSYPSFGAAYYLCSSRDMLSLRFY